MDIPAATQEALPPYPLGWKGPVQTAADADADTDAASPPEDIRRRHCDSPVWRGVDSGAEQEGYQGLREDDATGTDSRPAKFRAGSHKAC